MTKEHFRVVEMLEWHTMGKNWNTMSSVLWKYLKSKDFLELNILYGGSFRLNFWKDKSVILQF